LILNFYLIIIKFNFTNIFKSFNLLHFCIVLMIYLFVSLILLKMVKKVTFYIKIFYYFFNIDLKLIL